MTSSQFPESNDSEREPVDPDPDAGARAADGSEAGSEIDEYPEGVFDQGHAADEPGEGVFDQGHPEPEAQHGQGIFDQGHSEREHRHGQGVYEQGHSDTDDPEQDVSDDTDRVNH
jgi:hypothetical protein